jgi:uncharacterized protein YbjT (DUF2867 family)
LKKQTGSDDWHTVKETLMTILVTGATGNVGSLVVDRLLALGHRPRVFVRDEGKARSRYGDQVEVAVGDLTEPPSLEAALAGVSGLFLISTGRDLAARDQAAARAARRQGVKKLVKLSTADARHNVGSGVFHARGESAIRSAGINFVFVQPAGYMTNALGWAAPIKAEGVVRSCTGDGRIPMIHPGDIADVAATVLLTDGYDQTGLPITGPEALSFEQMTAKIAEATGRALTFWPVTESEARERRIAAGEDPAWVDDVDLPIWRAIRQGLLEEVTDTVERVTGRPPTTFGQWARQNAEAFR